MAGGMMLPMVVMMVMLMRSRVTAVTRMVVMVMMVLAGGGFVITQMVVMMVVVLTGGVFIITRMVMVVVMMDMLVIVHPADGGTDNGITGFTLLNAIGIFHRTYSRAVRQFIQFHTSPCMYSFTHKGNVKRGRNHGSAPFHQASTT